MANNNSKKSILTYTPGRAFQVKLRGKKQAKGLISLYLDYYLGTIKSPDTKTKDQRKFEFLNIHIKDNPQTTEDRQRNKESLDLALKIRENRESEFKHNQEGIIDPKKHKINFIDYFQKFLDNYPNKDVRIVRYCFEYFKKFVSNKYISPNEVTQEFLIQFKRYLEANLNGETPHNYFTKMKKVVKQAYNERIMINNTGENIKNTRNEGLKKDILSLDEIQKMASTFCVNSEIKRAFLFSLNTGLRYCDIKVLKWQNINQEQIIIKSQQKTDKPVYIDLNNTAQKLLGENRGKYDELVFHLPSLTGCLKTLKKWARNAGIEKNITWHSARHSIAVNLLTGGTDIKTVSSILGHAGLKHTEKYTRVVDELKKKAVNSLPEIDL